MSLPFTREQFFEVFARYNEGVMPLQLALLLLALSAFGAVVVRRRGSDRVVSAILAGLWAWMGIVYHFIYFAPVNPAARMFAAMFLVAAALFAWAGVARGRLVFDGESRARRVVGHALIAYALVGYPLLSLLLGRQFPELPTFGLPCPTTLFTAGVLLFLRRPYPRRVLIVPLAWALVGSQAALLLDVPQDFGLIVAAVALAWLALPIMSRKEAAA